ncbi:MAG: hypothetical protein LAT76_02740 [Schleiferiaceae bacterium]|nr:hypothetical protein [Schleiferiaceae bacterium]
MATFKRHLLVLLILFCCLPEGKAQQYLYLKKTGTTTMKRFQIGDNIAINFSREEPFFIEGQLRNIRKDLLQLNDDLYAISDIVQFRSTSREVTLLGNAMRWGSIGYVALMIINSTTDAGPMIHVNRALVAATILGASFPVKRAARKTYDLDKAWRLEIIDFDTFENEPTP